MIERNAWAEIDLSAVAHNMATARQRTLPGTKLCAVVKAEAYGHGAVPVANAAIAGGADFLAVAILQEAVSLRDAGINVPILILGTMQIEYAKEIVEYDIRQALYTWEAALALSVAAVKLGKPAKVHLAVDTGMNRIGNKLGEVGPFAARVATLPGVELEGIFSHFSTADSADKSFVEEQFAVFQAAIAEVEQAVHHKLPLRHIANSASLSEAPAMHLDMVRQGITLYGLWPSAEVKHDFVLQPVMRVKAQVVYLKEIGVGETIGYGRTFTTTRVTRVATLPLGYADGISRKLSNQGYVLLRGQKAPIVGRVCMDQMMVDVTDIPAVNVGDIALIFGGAELPVELVAQWMGTINYEVVCRIGMRLPRKFIYYSGTV
ncbi:MAG: alanine racemase [Acidaminococcaceae bacterium]